MRNIQTEMPLFHPALITMACWIKADQRLILESEPPCQHQSLGIRRTIQSALFNLQILIHKKNMFNADRRGYRISWRGGGEDIHKHHPLGHCIFTSTPLGHCPRDVIHPPINWKAPPLLDIHKHPPPLGHCGCDVIHIPRGVGVISAPVTHTLHRFFAGSGQVQGGGWSLPSPDPPPWIRHCVVTLHSYHYVVFS